MAKAANTKQMPISAKTGKIVSPEYAKKNPNTTVNLTVPVKKKTKK